MTAKVFDGKAEAKKREKALATRVGKLAKKGKKLKLVSVIVGENPASHLYVNLKGKAAARVGIEFEKQEWHQAHQGKWHFDKLLAVVARLNRDKGVTGIMVQLPLPKELRDRTLELVSAVDPAKDVDCLHPANLGLVMMGETRFLPATVKAALDIIDAEVNVAGKPVVVVGRSNIVGKPLAAELTNRDGVVTVAHSRVPDLKAVTKEAEVLVSATGIVNLITKDMVKPGAVVVDVGEPKGDVDFEGVSQVASVITPVPGGVGPMTVVSLLENVVL